MNNKSFNISKLKIDGEGKKPVEITFTKGLNVVTGPSDCGKSFLYKILYFILGGKEAPDIEQEVPESVGYTTFYLELKYNNGKVFTLKRHRENSSNVFVYDSVIDDISEDSIVTEVKYSGKENLSKFLLNIFGITEKIILRNKKDLGNLTFTEFKKLFFVDETSITDETKSPILTGQYTSSTKEKGVFKCFLCNEDDSDLKSESKSNDDVLKEKLKGKKEYISTLIAKLKDDIKNIKKNKPKEKIGDIEAKLSYLYENQNSIHKHVQDFNQNIKQINDEKNRLNDKLMQNNGLINRFKLLKEYYLNDLKRLAVIKEGNQKVSNLIDVNCPLCGSVSQKEEFHDFEQVVKSIEYEKNKILTNIKSLDCSLNDLFEQNKTIKSSEKEISKSYDKQLTYYKEFIEPKIQINQEELKNYIEVKSILLQEDKLNKDLQKYTEDITKVNVQIEELKPKEFEIHEMLLEKKELIGSVEDEIRNLINDWKIVSTTDKGKEPCNTVEFDFEKCDIRINGRQRKSFGKGIRAIFYSAFMIGFMNYCMNNDGLYHPGIVIIDSPLTTYKKGKSKGKNEDLDQETHQLFYSSLKKYSSSQIIIIENDDKAPNDSTDLNLIDLSLTNGLFPTT